jgi:predicted AAA+ superfamily ATPase
LLSRELGTKLTARYIDINLSPFDFSEFLRLKEFSVDKNDVYLSEKKAMIKKYFSEYVNSGGMPEYLIYHDENLIAKAYEDIIIKDIAIRYNIENVANMRELYRYLITNFSNKFSYQSLLKIVKIGSVNTVKKFIGYLSDAYVVSEVSKFDYSLKKQLVNEKKIYVSDNGFINRISMRFTKDIGRLLENLVYIKLSTRYAVNYYHSRHECDFIASQDNQTIIAIQVCSELNEQNRKREISGIVNAAKELNIPKALILTMDTEEIIETETTRINVMPVWKWLIVDMNKEIEQ